MRLNNLLLGAALATGVALAASTTFAAPITNGTLGLTFGTYTAENAAGTNVTLGAATAIDFSPLNAGAPNSTNTGTFLVNQATGSFAALVPIGSNGTIHDLILTPFASIASFFSVAGITFDLNGLSINTQNDTVLALTGSGVFHSGADVSAGLWSVSFQTDGANAIGEFTWSANATPVPEPATLALLGASLLGLGALRRRKA